LGHNRKKETIELHVDDHSILTPISANRLEAIRTYIGAHNHFLIKNHEVGYPFVRL